MRSDEQRPKTPSDAPAIVSIWKGTVPLQNKQVLSVELQLGKDGSAAWIESTYENWGHHDNKRPPLKIEILTGSYDKITRIEEPSVTVAGAEPFIEVKVVGLKIGDWVVNYHERKGNTIMRFENDYAGTLFLNEVYSISTKADILSRSERKHSSRPIIRILSILVFTMAVVALVLRMKAKRIGNPQALTHD
ncbi:MAG: hypothetical protein V4727_05210 [Verrucomicrobiota bacterium]